MYKRSFIINSFNNSWHISQTRKIDRNYSQSIGLHAPSISVVLFEHFLLTFTWKIPRMLFACASFEDVQGRRAKRRIKWRHSIFHSTVNIFCRLLRNLNQRLFLFVRAQSARLPSKAFFIFKVCNRSFKFDCSGSKIARCLSKSIKTVRLKTLEATLCIIAIVAIDDAPSIIGCETSSSETLIIASFFIESFVPRVLPSPSSGHNKLSQGTQLSGGTSKSGTNAYNSAFIFLQFLRQSYLLNTKRAQTRKIEQKKRIIHYLLYVPLLTKSLIASTGTASYVMTGNLFLK